MTSNFKKTCLERIISADETLALALIDNFLHASPELVKRIEKSHDVNEIASVACALYGMSFALGLEYFAKCCQHIEDHPTADRSRLRHAWAESCEWLNDFVRSRSSHVA